MSDSELVARIRADLEPQVSAAGLYLEGVRLARAGRHTRLQVIVDLPAGPGGVPQDALEEVSRVVSERLDQLDPLAGRYTLEVTTPGIERALATPRQWGRAVGQVVALELADGTTVQGRLEAVTATVATLQIGSLRRDFALADIAHAQMVVTF